MKLFKTLFKNPFFIKMLIAEIIIVAAFSAKLFLRAPHEKTLLSNNFTVEGIDNDKVEILPDGSLKIDGDGSDLTIECKAVSLPAGRYTVCTDYAGNDINYKDDCISIYSPTNGIYQSWNIADWYQNITREVYVTKDGGDLNIAIHYSGSGSFILRSINFHELGRMYRLLTILALFLLLDALCVIYILKLPGYTDTPDWKRLRIIVAVLSSVIMFTSLPLFMDSIPDGDDLGFHLSRICSIAEELAHGQFPVRIYHSFNGGQGYPCSIFYGDILLYIPAVLLCLGIPVFRAYQFYLLLINILTAVLSYISIKKCLAISEPDLSARLYTVAPHIG